MRYFAGAFTVTLYSTDTAFYRDNLDVERPQPVGRRCGRKGRSRRSRSSRVTADPTEGEGYTQTGTNVVEVIDMPDWIAAEDRRVRRGAPCRAGVREAQAGQAAARHDAVGERPVDDGSHERGNDEQSRGQRRAVPVALVAAEARRRAKRDASRRLASTIGRWPRAGCAEAAAADATAKPARSRARSVDAAERRGSDGGQRYHRVPRQARAGGSAQCRAGRMWTLDPTIRDFIEVAENQWNWNVPGGAPFYEEILTTPGEAMQAVAQAGARGRQVAARIGSLQPECPQPCPRLKDNTREVEKASARCRTAP